jgi:hypothetical protein
MQTIVNDTLCRMIPFQRYAGQMYAASTRASVQSSAVAAMDEEIQGRWRPSHRTVERETM